EKAVKQMLALAVQEAYQEGRIRYHRALAAQNSRQVASQGDFVLEPSVAYFEPPLNLELQPEAIRHALTACTGVLNYPDSARCSAELHFLPVRSYLVNSEGTSIVQNGIRTALTVTLSGTADDGTPLSLYKHYYGTVPDDLPLAEELARDVQAMEKTMTQLRHSRQGTASLCPVLFEDEASPVFWQYALTPMLLSPEAPLNATLTPSHWKVVSDPTETLYNNSKLFGSYFYDDEGKEGERLVLIDNGQLVTVPYAANNSRQFHHSNGHGRSSLDRTPVPVPANLLVSTSTPLSQNELYQQFKQTIAAQHADFGYRVSAASIEGNVIRPSVIWKVFADSRPDELVHGMELSGTSRMLLSQISGGGSLPACLPDTVNGAHFHCCAPSTLVKLMEARLSTQMSFPPAIASLEGNSDMEEVLDDEMLFKAMEDDIQSSLDSFKTDILPRAYYIRHMVTDAQSFHVSSILGSTASAASRPVRTVETRVLVGDNTFNNDNVIDEQSRDVATRDLPWGDNYSHIRRELHAATEAAYRQALCQYAEKEQQLKLLGDSVRHALLPDRKPAWVTNMSIESPYEATTSAQLEELANSLSHQFYRYDFLTLSRVDVDAYCGSVSFRGSDGTRYKQPLNVLRIRAVAETIANDGTPLHDEIEFLYRHIQDISQRDEILSSIGEMVERLQQWRTAPLVSTSYTGPVLFEGGAAATMFARAFVENRPNLVATRPKIRIGSRNLLPELVRYPSLVDKIEQRVVSNIVSISALNNKSTNPPMLGNSAIDADGVKIEPQWELIHRGKVVSLLQTRVPSDAHSESNGHQRLALHDGHISSAPGPGVLEMSCQKTVEKKQLYKSLRKLAQAADLKYAYVIHKTIMENGKVKPVFVSRMDVTTGKLTPVRIPAAIDCNMNDFMHLAAASRSTMICNYLAPTGFSDARRSGESLEGIPCSFILPDALLIDNFNILNNNK
ncbi:MAG: hypothetical protein J6S48_02200, partial [Bacteroidales bacterium]|nr:hypothetical protein [Bacteroidales bacterium]